MGIFLIQPVYVNVELNSTKLKKCIFEEWFLLESTFGYVLNSLIIFIHYQDDLSIQLFYTPRTEPEFTT